MPSLSMSLPNLIGDGAGVATFLMERLIDWARAERLDRLVLHASDEGRALYERWASFRLTRCVSKTGSTFRKSGKVVR